MVRADDEVALPLPGRGTILDVGRPLPTDAAATIRPRPWPVRLESG